MTLDELVKDIDLQDVREKDLTGEKVNSLYLDAENVKAKGRQFVKVLCWLGLILAAAVLVGFVLHLLFPGAEWLWQRG